MRSDKNIVGIIGAGNIGHAFARVALRAGRSVVIANRTASTALRDVVAGLGPEAAAGTVADAASAPVVVIAVPWPNVPDAVAGLDWDGQIVIDASNPMTVSFSDGTPTLQFAELNGRTSSEIVADLVPGARVVKAANTLSADILGADPREAGGHRVLFLSGDDRAAKEEVAALLAAAGLAPADLGGLVQGGSLQQAPDGALAGLNLIRLG